MCSRSMARRPKKWTVMVYLAGDNNLESFGQGDLIEMKSVGSTDAINIVAQFDRMSDDVTRRYYLTHDRPLSADVVAELPEVNTGDPAALLDFIRWGLAEYPAECTALILWNHGAGWKDDDIYAIARLAGLAESDLPRSQVRGLNQRTIGRTLFATSVRTILRYPASVRAILFDDTSKDFLDNQELKGTLDRVLADRKGQKLDLIGFDACLMNMVEVAYQVQHACSYMVGSQEIEPADGWPYDRILAALAAEPDMPAEALARTIVNAYADYYTENPTNIAVTQSAVRLHSVSALANTVGRLAESLIERLPDPAWSSQTLMPAMRQVQKFRDRQYVDLGHFGQLLVEGAGDSSVNVAAQDVVARLDPTSANSAMVAARGIAPTATLALNPALRSRDVLRPGSPGGLDMINTHGLSIYVPFLGSISPAYAELEFARNVSWPQFLKTFGES